MPARIVCKVGELKGLARRFEDEIVLGRSSKCSLNLQVAMISGRHAKISFNNDLGRYQLEDLGSTNGTKLDGIRVLKPEPLDHLHVITLAGAHDLIFQDLDRCAKRHEGIQPLPTQPKSEEEPLVAPDPRTGGDQPRTQIFDELPLMPGLLTYQATHNQPFVFEEFHEDRPEERTNRGLELPLELPDFLLGSEGKPASAPVAAKPQPHPMVAETLDLEDARKQEPQEASPSQVAQLMLGEEAQTLLLEITFPDGEVKVFSLKEGDNVIGRGTDTDHQVPSLAVSRRHALLQVRSGKVRVKDLGSRNHTYVDGVQVTDTVAVPMSAMLQFGALNARLLAAKGA